MKRLLTLLLTLTLLTTAVFAQDARVTVSGKVTSKNDGDALIGVTIIEKGTTNGTITDIDGNYTLVVAENATLTASYVGYQSLEFVVPKNGGTINFLLEEDNVGHEEVVVIGYGVQKKSVVTAAISGISAEDIQGSSVRVDNALKGMTSGVTATAASGQPGEGAQIRIRGVGTINNSNPLYVVDGMPIDGGIDYLNPNDIQSIEVLKDAASGAVYGARAANGVILVTTKKGKSGAPKVSYDFSYGFQNPWKMRDVLNATEYATMVNEGAINSGLEPIYENPAQYGEGTNWQKEVFNANAPILNHQLSIAGANDRVNYFISSGFYRQEGIVGGNFNRSNYQRFTLRSNTIYSLVDSKDRIFLNKIDAGLNVSYSHIKSAGIETNSSFGSALGSALSLSPIMTVYAEDPEAVLERYAATANFVPVYSADGRLYSIAGTNFNEMTNPLASLSLPGSDNWSDHIVGNMFAEITLIENLKFRSSFGTDMSFWGYDGYNKRFWLTPNNYSDRTKVYGEMDKNFTWQLENTLSYDKTISDHHFNILLGQSALEYTGRNIGGSAYDMKDELSPRANLSFTTGLAADGDQTVYGGEFNPHTLASLFARASYDYKGRYMAQFTIRRDGSSNFGPDKHYATFPSFSLGWNITEESFLANRPSWLESAKLRFSWGKNGNESIGQFRYTSLTSSGNNYIFGSGADEKVTNGTKPSVLPNTVLCWEESKQTDLGLDLGFYKNALTVTIDWYKKRTDGMLMEMPIPSYVGEQKPTGNVGIMDNKGWEFDVTYRWKAGAWNFKINANATYLKNELINYGNEEGYANLDSQQGMGTITRAENGYPFPFFYGYKTNGIFQNFAQINAYTNAEGELLQPDAKPGDVIFVDNNNDGEITEADKTQIGKGMPDWTYGLNFSADYKGFDFSMQFNGTFGNDIYDATRRNDINYQNLPAFMKDRWTGENTSNKYPKYVWGDTKNWQSSDLFVSNGSFLRLRNIELGYTLPQYITKKAFIERVRFYVAAQNLLTLTKYEGFDPEISSGGTSLGIDRGVYPQARVITFGVNVNF
ncbi:MAG: TonB-dependent receptor [Bacteroidales bacterium]|nr:TonB-dependent receptor [Bacteroidales bacterium]